MILKKLSSVVAVLVIGLASNSMVEADPKHNKHRKHHKQDPLLAVAYDVEESARSIHRLAERTAHRRTARDQRALRRLHELDDEARDFRRALSRFGPYSGRVRVEYRELQRAFTRSQQTFRGIRTRRVVVREFRELAYMMDDLSYRYETRLARHDRNRRYGHPRSGKSGGYVQIEGHGDRGHASIGYSWDND
jgi:hypothetical protein